MIQFFFVVFDAVPQKWLHQQSLSPPPIPSLEALNWNSITIITILQNNWTLAYFRCWTWFLLCFGPLQCFYQKWGEFFYKSNNAFNADTSYNLLPNSFKLFFFMFTCLNCLYNKLIIILLIYSPKNFALVLVLPLPCFSILPLLDLPLSPYPLPFLPCLSPTPKCITLLLCCYLLCIQFVQMDSFHFNPSA